MRLLRKLSTHLDKPKATTDDLFNTLSSSTWKTGLEIIAELESKGFRAGHFRGAMYVYFSKWEEEGLIKHRIRKTSEKTA
ncbi:MAG: hypothetical protein PHU12_03705, partial [Candidatus Aenigmarchaeota archaeon]|nr:hypothetical protein [Candidatus Aenigmarchaeota archaeon]